MGHLRGWSDEDLDRLLAGKAPDGDPAGGDLADFIRQVKKASMVAPDRAVADRHLAMIVDAARLVSDKGDPAVRPASKADGPAGQASGLPKWRRRTVLSTLFASLSAKVTAVAFAATAATGGLAATGALPDAAQQAMSDLAARVGISIPSPHDASGDRRQDADNRRDEDAGKRVDGDVRTVLEDGSLTGKEKGGAVSDAADQNRRDAVVPAGAGQTPGAESNPTGYGDPAVPPGNPTGFGEGSQPSGNPTGFGEPTTPAPNAPAPTPTSNPTGFGQP